MSPESLLKDLNTLNMTELTLFDLSSTDRLELAQNIKKRLLDLKRDYKNILKQIADKWDARNPDKARMERLEMRPYLLLEEDFNKILDFIDKIIIHNGEQIFPTPNINTHIWVVENGDWLIGQKNDYRKWYYFQTTNKLTKKFRAYCKEVEKEKNLRILSIEIAKEDLLEKQIIQRQEITKGILNIIIVFIFFLTMSFLPVVLNNITTESNYYNQLGEINWKMVFSLGYVFFVPILLVILVATKISFIINSIISILSLPKLIKSQLELDKQIPIKTKEFEQRLKQIDLKYEKKLIRAKNAFETKLQKLKLLYQIDET